MTHPAIETTNLTKQYGDITAVKNLSLRVDQGEIYAFLGLNGAGKTTTIRMLLGMVKSTAGQAYVLGHRIHPGSRRAWPEVGYLVETPYAYPELTVRENLDIVRRLRPGTPSGNVDWIITLLGLSAYADRKAGTLSLGNSQRLGLAKALLHRPGLLLLDEPANGLDPAGIVEIRNLLRKLVKEDGVTIFMSSHILGEVWRLADRIGVIHKGELLQELDVTEIMENLHRRLQIRARDTTEAYTVIQKAGISARLSSEDIIEIESRDIIDHPEEISTLLVKAGHPPTMIFVEQEDLEHYFLRLVGTNGEMEK